MIRGAANIGFSIGTGNVSGPIPGQSFRNIPTPNFQPAVYALVIRSPMPPYAAVYGYTFPLSPEAIRKEYSAMSSIYDVAGSPSQLGVQRIVDQFGNSPVIYTIEGTTGWQYHGTDGYTLTGLQSIIALENLLAQYAFLNQQQAQNNVPNLYVLEFYDYFKGDFWEVVPVGPQGIRQNRQRPLLLTYFFRLAGIRPLNAPPAAPVNDPIANVLTQTPTQAAASLSLNIGAVQAHYGGITLAVQ